jgi:hypothetical protein
MKVIGFNFTKINAEKTKPKVEQAKIKVNMDVNSIEALTSTLLSTEEDILGIEFTYSIDYEPEAAKISLDGRVMLSLEPEMAKEVLKEWEEKKTPENFRFVLFNLILRKSNLKALQLEDELGLPPHIPMPSLKKEDSSKKEQD